MVAKAEREEVSADAREEGRGQEGHVQEAHGRETDGRAAGHRRRREGRLAELLRQWWERDPSLLGDEISRLESVAAAPDLLAYGAHIPSAEQVRLADLAEELRQIAGVLRALRGQLERRGGTTDPSAIAGAFDVVGARTSRAEVRPDPAGTPSVAA